MLDRSVPGSKNKEMAASMDIDKPVASGWQTGVSAMAEASELSGLPATGGKSTSAPWCSIAKVRSSTAKRVALRLTRKTRI